MDLECGHVRLRCVSQEQSAARRPVSRQRASGFCHLVASENFRVLRVLGIWAGGGCGWPRQLMISKLPPPPGRRGGGTARLDLVFVKRSKPPKIRSKARTTIRNPRNSMQLPPAIQGAQYLLDHLPALAILNGYACHWSTDAVEPEQARRSINNRDDAIVNPRDGSFRRDPAVSGGFAGHPARNYGLLFHGCWAGAEGQPANHHAHEQDSERRQDYCRSARPPRYRARRPWPKSLLRVIRAELARRGW